MLSKADVIRRIAEKAAHLERLHSQNAPVADILRMRKSLDKWNRKLAKR